MVLHIGSSRCNTIGRRNLEGIAVWFCLISFSCSLVVHVISDVWLGLGGVYD